MRSVPLLVSIATASVLVFSGCLGASHNDMAGMDMTNHHAMEAVNPELANFKLELKGCSEGGGVSLYNTPEGTTGPVPGGPFKLTSISDDTGNPMVASYGQPIPPGGATSGIWHTALYCDHYIFNGEDRGVFRGGWVGQRIQPPSWDDSGITRQYFVADFSISDPDVVHVLQDDAHVMVSRNLDTKIEWVGPMALHAVLSDEDHGVFETHAKMKDYRDLPSGTTRFWMLVPADGQMHHHHNGDPAADAKGKFVPISFDLVNTATSGKHLVVDGTAWLSHTRTDEHGQVPGTAGNVGGLLFTGFDRTVTLGPAPEGLVFDHTWVH